MENQNTASRFKIIVAGHVALDITPTFSDRYLGKTLQDIIRPGKLVNVGKAEFSPGGCVTNTGLALHKFGAEVILVAKTGDDMFGKMLVERYRALNVEPSFVISEADNTSYAIAIAPPGCDRVFLHDPAANHSFVEADIPDEMLAQAQFFHFGYPTLMRGFYKDDGAGFTRLYQRAKAAGLVTSVDMAAIDPEAEAAAVDWAGVLENTLPYVDFFMPSIEELCYMLDRPAYEEWQHRAAGRDICTVLSLEKDVKPLAKKTLRLGCRALLLKCGVAGLYLQTAPKEAMRQLPSMLGAGIWDDVSLFEKSFVPDRVRSTAGAGDTSIAAFLYGMTSGFTPDECLAVAAATGACCVTQYDTLSGLLPINELREKIQGGWKKQHYIQA